VAKKRNFGFIEANFMVLCSPENVFYALEKSMHSTAVSWSVLRTLVRSS
jgi:hypothetical protein